MAPARTASTCSASDPPTTATSAPAACSAAHPDMARTSAAASPPPAPATTASRPPSARHSRSTAASARSGSPAAPPSATRRASADAGPVLLGQAEREEAPDPDADGARVGLLPGGLDDGARVDPGLEWAGGGEELAEPSDPVLPGHDLGGLGLPEADEREHGHGLGLELVGGPGGEGGVEGAPWRAPGACGAQGGPGCLGVACLGVGMRSTPMERCATHHSWMRRRRKEERERADWWARFLQGVLRCVGDKNQRLECAVHNFKEWSVLCTNSPFGDVLQTNFPKRIGQILTRI